MSQFVFVPIFGIRPVESQRKSPSNDRRFIIRRIFWNNETLSAQVIYNDAIHTQRSTADSQENQTRQ